MTLIVRSEIRESIAEACENGVRKISFAKIQELKSLIMPRAPDSSSGAEFISFTNGIGH